MPTTFNVLSLGVQADIDTTEGNTLAENAGALVGLTFGDLFDPLWEQVQQLTPGSTGTAGGTNTAYDQNNSPAETFILDGGPEQTFDSSVIYNATITYTDGTTATITAVVFQDTAGNTYLAPEFSANGDQTTLEAGPIRSLTLGSLSGDTFSGLTASRQTSNYAVCFTSGTLIRTPKGDVPIETLQPGDLVVTLDNGAQPIRWIRGRMSPAVGPRTPIVIEAGALGKNTPSKRLVVSRQHRMLADTIVSTRMFGTSQTLIAANKLLGLPGVSEAENTGFVTYWHFMCDAHEIVFANDAPAETLFLGAQARGSMPSDALEEIHALFPELENTCARPTPARPLPNQRQQLSFTQRLVRNGKRPLEAFA